MRNCIYFFFIFFSAFSLHGKDYIVTVVQMEWHTTLVLKTANIPDSILNRLPGPPGGSYVDISWGDQNFYQAEGRPVYYAVAAVLWPTPAVIRIRNWYRKERLLKGAKRDVKISVSDTQFINLCQFVANSLVRTEKGKVIPARKNNFYLAKRAYSMFRTCHTWIALALNHAGLEINPFMVINANSLFRQLEE